jgi:hypothetical protein
VWLTQIPASVQARCSAVLSSLTSKDYVTLCLIEQTCDAVRAYYSVPRLDYGDVQFAATHAVFSVY